MSRCGEPLGSLPRTRGAASDQAGWKNCEAASSSAGKRSIVRPFALREERASDVASMNTRFFRSTRVSNEQSWIIIRECLSVPIVTSLPVKSEL